MQTILIVHLLHCFKLYEAYLGILINFCYLEMEIKWNESMNIGDTVMVVADRHPQSMLNELKCKFSFGKIFVLFDRFMPKSHNHTKNRV